MPQSSKTRKPRRARPTRAGRPKDQADDTQMYDVADLFYLQNKTRAEISHTLGLDPRKTAWLLTEAQRLGVVRIDIRRPAAQELAAQIKRKFPHLEKVLVASGPQIETVEQCDELIRRFAVLAADYFEELHSQHPRGKAFHVGVSGSEHLAFALAVPERKRENVFVHVTALVGQRRLEETASHINPSVVASILWTRCGSLPGRCEYATVSPYDPSQAEGLEVIAKELEKLKDNKEITKVLDAMNSLDVVFGGIGNPHPRGLPRKLRQRFSNEFTMLAVLRPLVSSEDLRGAVGDFCYCPYDEQGLAKPPEQPDDRPPWRFFMTAGRYTDHPDIAFYRDMVKRGKKVVGFAAPHMLPAIKGALRGEIINALIIDEHSARQIAEAS